MKKRAYLHLGIETLLLIVLIVSLSGWQRENSLTHAFNYTLDMDQVLQNSKIQKLSGSIDDLDKVMNDQLDAFFGKSAEELYQNMSSADAVRSAKENAMGMYLPEQLNGNTLDVVSNVSSMQGKLAEDTFFGAAASLSAMNAKYVNDKTKEMVEIQEKLNKAKSKYNKIMKDIVGLEDSISSKLPKLAPM